MATPMGSGPLERFTKRMVIGDTVLNDGHTYSIINEYWNTSQLRRTAYIRIDTSTLEIIERMDLNVETIDSLACSRIDTIVSTLKITSESIDTLFGMVLPIRIAERKQSYNYSVRRMFGWGLGLIQYHNLTDGWGLGYTLIYAKINGIEYGAPSNMDSLLQFHPMAIGNEWIYSYYSDNTVKPVIKKVIRDSIVQGKVYSVIETHYPGSNLKYYHFERLDSVYGVLTDGITGNGTLLDSIPAPFGKYFGEWREVDQIAPEVIMGIPVITRTILYRVIITYPRSTYAWGIGLVRLLSQEEHPSLPMLTIRLLQIVHATINGKEYGTKNILMADSLTQYHPLQTGNKWIYRTTTYAPSSPPTISYRYREVTGDTIIGSIQYKRVAENITGRSAERFDYITGNFITHGVSGPVIEDSTAANIIDSNFGEYGGRKLVAVFTDSIFGTARLHREIRMDNHVAEYEQGWIYAHGLGRVKHYIKELDPSPYGIFDEDLVYAKINGIEYGTEPLGVDNESQWAPVEFSLYQNYPNPFNPSTVIEFAVPAATSRDIVTLRIFDMLGREIRTLVNEPLPHGRHNVRFDATGLATGLYFYHIQSGAFAETKKMMYLK
ncbi:MAG: T9SS type A sorting domain-containing protein [Bacteroidota bacterium]